MKRMTWILILLAGCGDPAPMDKLIPKTVRAHLESPDSVQAFRLHPGPFPSGGKKIEDWPDVPTTAEALVGGDLRLELSRLLLNSASYDLEEGKGCKPRPGVKIRFTRDDTRVEVYLCFECLMIAFYGGGGNGENAWGNFDPSAAALSRIVKKLFPSDPVIQGLK